MDNPQHHIRVRKGDVARFVLLPGDPARAEVIAQHFDQPRKIAYNREYQTFTGLTGAVPVSVTSTGIGCPAVAIAVEELVRVGADTLIRVGTGGAMQEQILPGELVIATGAIRAEGTTRAYLPLEFPAVADPDVEQALSSAAASQGLKWRRGIVHTKDSFYGQKEPQRMPVAYQLQAEWNAYIQGGALLSEMESAALFVISSVLQVRAGSICAVASNGWRKVRWTENESRQAIDEMIECTLAAVRQLAKMDETRSANHP